MRLSYSLGLPSDLRYVSVVRHLCAGTLAELGVSEGCVDDIALAVTEACANVVQHVVGHEDFEVRIEVEDRVCRIEVVDRAGSEGGAVPAAPRPVPVVGAGAGASAEELLTHGRGLDLMRILVDQLHFAPGAEGSTVVLVKELELSAGSVLGGGPGA